MRKRERERVEREWWDERESGARECGEREWVRESGVKVRRVG